ncbi:MAG TPA: ribosome maturation factor RimM [Bacilli bacterium]|nr:ribosome maturation factor RimM [Bacilli bacterium]
MKYIEIGKVVATHGIKGELKIISDSDFKEMRFRKGNVVYFEFDKKKMPVTITSNRTHKHYELITINSLFDINAVEQYIGCGVYIDKNQLGQLEEGEYFADDLIDKRVTLMDGTVIGVVIDILDLPQGEILVIQKENKKQIMIPFVDEFIDSVTEEAILITPIEGMIE